MNKVDVKAREKAATYENQKNQSAQNVPEQTPEEQNSAAPAPRSEAAWNDLISHRIEEATRNGAFDNLRNKGKPLAHERNPFVPADQQMANDLLKNNGLAPHWISERTAMLETIARFRLRFHLLAQQFHQAWLGTSDGKEKAVLQANWQRQIEQWQDEIKELNRRITSVNLQQPIARLEIFKVLLDEELTRAGMKRTL